MDPYTLPALPYAYDALEPYIDAQTMTIHHDKHHKAYLDKLVAALDKHPELKNKTPLELVKNLAVVPEDIRTMVRNHGGGFVNHTFFWETLKKDVAIHGAISEAITVSFGNFELFKKQFSDAAVSVFGSGWAWLVLDHGKLAIITLPNQDSPHSSGKIPLLGLDVWEHAYYLKYQNRRPEYIEAFFSVINWDAVNKEYLKHK